MDSIETIVIRVETDNPSPSREEILDYYSEGGAVYEALLKREWINKEGKALAHLKGDKVICTPKSNGMYEAVFRYTIINSHSTNKYP